MRALTTEGEMEKPGDTLRATIAGEIRKWKNPTSARFGPSVAEWTRYLDLADRILELVDRETQPVGWIVLWHEDGHVGIASDRTTYEPPPGKYRLQTREEAEAFVEEANLQGPAFYTMHPVPPAAEDTEAP